MVVDGEAGEDEEGAKGQKAAEDEKGAEDQRAAEDEGDAGTSAPGYDAILGWCREAVHDDWQLRPNPLNVAGGVGPGAEGLHRILEVQARPPRVRDS